MLITSGINLAEAAIANVRSASPGTNPQLGTLMVWYVPTSVANSNRVACGKGGGTQGVTHARNGGDGTKVEFAATRATTVQNVISNTAALTVGVPVCLGGQFDIANGGPTLHIGYLGIPLASNVGSSQNGSGSHTSTTGDYRLGATGANAAGGTYLAFAFFTVRLTLQEMTAWQMHPTPNIRGCDVFWKCGANGGGRVYDLTGHSWHGTPTTVTSPSLSLPRPGTRLHP